MEKGEELEMDQTIRWSDGNLKILARTLVVFDNIALVLDTKGKSKSCLWAAFIWSREPSASCRKPRHDPSVSCLHVYLRVVENVFNQVVNNPGFGLRSEPCHKSMSSSRKAALQASNYYPT